jgi:hypothetical protein
MLLAIDLTAELPAERIYQTADSRLHVRANDVLIVLPPKPLCQYKWCLRVAHNSLIFSPRCRPPSPPTD